MDGVGIGVSIRSNRYSWVKGRELLVKIAIMTDVHANLPALQAALTRIRQEGCDAVYHTGDVIGIGPFPEECLDLLLSQPDVRLLMGNHDAYFAIGLPDPRPEWMSDGELEHQHWVHSRLDSSHRRAVAEWPYRIDDDFGALTASFMHYALDEAGRDFASAVRTPGPEQLDELFHGCESDVVFFGHDHGASEVEGIRKYLNPGSLGCAPEAISRFAVLDCGDSCFHIRCLAEPYDDTELKRAFESRGVPERQFIYKAFFGGRFF